MWIKICANTNLDDAQAAAACGADAVGFVFAPSRRQVTAAQVAAISARLPVGVERVGVFANEPPERIASIVAEAGLTAVQLHQGLSRALAADLQQCLDPAVALIGVLHWQVAQADGADGTDPAKLATEVAKLEGAGHRTLIDAQAGRDSGGLGIPFEWAHAVPLFEEMRSARIVVAGGLTTGNVGEAIHLLRPYGVDVASGVEREAGRKDHEKLRLFIQNARNA